VSTAYERNLALIRLVEAEGIARVDPPMLLEANQYFELAGEEFGRSLMMSLGNDGVEYCLRPEFTIPIVAQYVKQGLAGAPAAYSYMGPVFRQNGTGPTEYVQAGVELLGQPDSDRALDEVLTFARRTLGVYGVAAPRIRLGGVALFEALLANADMPEAWRPRLRHRFGHPDAMARLLDRVTADEGTTVSMEPGGAEALVDYIAEQMLAAGFNPETGRRPEEVAARYAEKLALAAARVPAETVAMLRLYLSIEGPAITAFDEIEALGAHYRMDLAAPLAALRRHQAMLARLAPEAEIRFDASFSPRLDYYTGVVFEMLSPLGAVLASGGQYDRLLQLLGAGRPVAASGCAVWVNRLEQEFGG